MLYVWTIQVRNIDKLEIIIIMIIDIHMTHRLAIYHLYTQWTPSHYKGSFYIDARPPVECEASGARSVQSFQVFSTCSLSRVVHCDDIKHNHTNDLFQTRI